MLYHCIGVLPDDQIGARQRLLLGGNIDIEVRIELIRERISTPSSVLACSSIRLFAWE